MIIKPYIEKPRFTNTCGYCKFIGIIEGEDIYICGFLNESRKDFFRFDGTDQMGRVITSESAFYDRALSLAISKGHQVL